MYARAVPDGPAPLLSTRHRVVLAILLTGGAVWLVLAPGFREIAGYVSIWAGPGPRFGVIAHPLIGVSTAPLLCLLAAGIALAGQRSAAWLGLGLGSAGLLQACLAQQRSFPLGAGEPPWGIVIFALLLVGAVWVAMGRQGAGVRRPGVAVAAAAVLASALLPTWLSDGVLAPTDRHWAWCLLAVLLGWGAARSGRGAPGLQRVGAALSVLWLVADVLTSSVSGAGWLAVGLAAFAVVAAALAALRPGGAAGGRGGGLALGAAVAIGLALFLAWPMVRPIPGPIQAVCPSAGGVRVVHLGTLYDELGLSAYQARLRLRPSRAIVVTERSAERGIIETARADAAALACGGEAPMCLPGPGMASGPGRVVACNSEVRITSDRVPADGRAGSRLVGVRGDWALELGAGIDGSVVAPRGLIPTDRYLPIVVRPSLVASRHGEDARDRLVVVDTEQRRRIATWRIERDDAAPSIAFGAGYAWLVLKEDAAVAVRTEDGVVVGAASLGEPDRYCGSTPRFAVASGEHLWIASCRAIFALAAEPVALMSAVGAGVRPSPSEVRGVLTALSPDATIPPPRGVGQERVATALTDWDFRFRLGAPEAEDGWRFGGDEAARRTGRRHVGAATRGEERIEVHVEGEWGALREWLVRRIRLVLPGAAPSCATGEFLGRSDAQRCVAQPPEGPSVDAVAVRSGGASYAVVVVGSADAARAAALRLGFTLIDGPVSSRPLPGPHPDADGSDWWVRGGVYENGAAGVRVAPPPGWRLVVAPIALGEGRVGLERRGLPAALVRIEFRRARVSDPSGWRTQWLASARSRGGREVALRLWGDRGVAVELPAGTVEAARHLGRMVLVLTSRVFEQRGAVAREALEEVAPAVALIEDATDLRRRLQARVDPHAEVHSDVSVRWGALRDFRAQYRWHRPRRGFWRVDLSERRSDLGGEQLAIFEETAHGLTASLARHPGPVPEDPLMGRRVVDLRVGAGLLRLTITGLRRDLEAGADAIGALVAGFHIDATSAGYAIVGTQTLRDLDFGVEVTLPVGWAPGACVRRWPARDAHQMALLCRRGDHTLMELVVTHHRGVVTPTDDAVAELVRTLEPRGRVEVSVAQLGGWPATEVRWAGGGQLERYWLATVGPTAIRLRTTTRVMARHLTVDADRWVRLLDLPAPAGAEAD